MFQSVREYATLTAAITLLAVSPAHAQDATWPREIPTDQGTLILYQPQPETFSGNVLTGRAAASYTARETADPIFGTLWFTARSAEGDLLRVSPIDLEPTTLSCVY